VTAAADFQECYASAFDGYVDDPGEAALSAAYELGRSAVRRGLTVLDLASVHHDTLARAAAAARTGGDLDAVMGAGGAFFLEAVSAFEMVRRVLQEAREAADVERRQAAALRRLSSFLGDASIALDASSSLAEMLQLVAEHAREVLEADSCLVRLVIDARELEADAAAERAAPARASDLSALFAAVGAPGASLRMSAAELARHPALPALEPKARDAVPAPSAGASARGWLAARLTALDGRDIGLIQLFARPGEGFSELDEAVLVQLAQMASAAVERAQLYSG
jgi:hypothetical protein